MSSRVSSSFHHLASLNINTSSTDQEHSSQDRVTRSKPQPSSESASIVTVTIGALSDDCLLCIFGHYHRDVQYPRSWWHPLVHICRRWRHVVFSCPGHLNLRHVCKSKTHLQATLDVWPALPIDIEASFNRCTDSDERDIIGALKYRNRIAGISLWDIGTTQLKKCIKSMQKPFPLLTSLHLIADARVEFVITDAFLGGSAPRLRDVVFQDVQFPTLPNLLSSTSHLVHLALVCIRVTHRGHWLISPNAMATCLFALTKLQYLYITVECGLHPPTQPPPESAPIIFPALTDFMLGGPHEYFRDLITRIDAPQLETSCLHFSGELILDTPRLPQFIRLTEMSEFTLHLYVTFDIYGVGLLFCPSIGHAQFELSLQCTGEITTQLELMKRICAPCLFLFSQVKWLEIDGHGDSLQWSPHSTMSERWLGFLRPFTAVETLLPRRMVMPHIATALGSLTETRAAEVLPTLQTILIMASESDFFHATELFNPFIVASDQANCPVTMKTIDSDEWECFFD